MSRHTPDRSDEHFVDTQPFDPWDKEELSPAQEKYFLASQWKLIWWRLKQHRLALISLIILAIMYSAIFIVEFLAPYAQESRDSQNIHHPPQGIHLFDDGSFVGPFTYGTDFSIDMETLKPIYTPNPEKIDRLRFLCSGDKYEFWGLFDASLHLVCPAKDGTLFLLGTDRLGRDMFSRIIYGARISLTIGLVGIAVSFVLGVLIGGAAGYFGGWVDSCVQRVIEVIRSLPEIPLWMALSAALPVTWSPVLIYFGITIILGLIDWTGLARAVRSKFLALREEDYALAARLTGATPKRIIARHLLPNFASHLIASVTLSIPNMILGETALSFLGLGLRPPVTSWGVLLNEAQNINAVAVYPWLMLPVVPVIIVVLAFNFLGDGLRDAADPYKN
ncbi:MULTISPECIES: ABC transporter permease [unclassified Thalassospira]|uniref:ABC transporter permease n=1 Tax=unclassified Thalassospira TaxID=2648997 RepID=UPI000A1FC2FA|nr:ABC transporter permease [Thalassospira sp. MCCC 1A01428]OSQ42835.1 peptide ABC transporter permease [Thalassospira sp. MCCC 1A01428]